MKYYKAILSFLLISVIFTSCSSDSKDVDFEPSEAVNEIISTVEMSSMAEVGSDRLNSYIDIDQSEIEKYSMYICGSGGFADEVAVFKMKSEDSAAKLKELFTQRIEKRKADFKDYNPDEYTKLGNALISVKGKYVFVSVTGDNDTAQSIFLKYYNK